MPRCNMAHDGTQQSTRHRTIVWGIATMERRDMVWQRHNVMCNMTIQWDDETLGDAMGQDGSTQWTTRWDVRTTRCKATGDGIQQSTTCRIMGRGVTTTKTWCERAASKWQNKTTTRRTTRWVDAMTQHNMRWHTTINTTWLFSQFWLFVRFSWTWYRKGRTCQCFDRRAIFFHLAYGTVLVKRFHSLGYRRLTSASTEERECGC
jgi:hypothetical protein